MDSCHGGGRHEAWEHPAMDLAKVGVGGPRGGVNTEFEAHQPIGAEMLQVEDHRRVCMYATIPEEAPLDSASCKPK